MKSDKSRETFVPEKHYSSVRLQQGRVLTDADWNEQSDVIQHRNEVTSRDVIGASGVPVPPDGFQILPFQAAPGVVDFTVTAGRIYVDGILCELDNQTTYTSQPDLFFDRAAVTHDPLTDLSTAPVPPLLSSGMVVAYLDVWQRHIGVVEDPTIRETALGGPDTASRAKTVFQVKTLNLPDRSPPLGPIDDLPEFQALTITNPGLLSARVQPVADENNPCIIPDSAGFTRLENQLYRVEIHVGGELIPSPDGADALVVAAGSQQPTFKWSRDNGSVVARWLDDPNAVLGTLKVELPTRDETRGFAANQWVELSDDRRDLTGVAGVFVKLIKVDGDTLFFDPATVQDPLGLVLPGEQPARLPDQFHPKIRRWDMPADAPGPLDVMINSSNGGFLDLESGVQIRFSIQGGVFSVGDYWVIPARTITNDIEFPAGDQPPLGIKHHITCLASFPVSNLGAVTDCRKRFHPLTDLNPVVPTDEPHPGQFRYYLVDGNSEGFGDDSTGRVGIDDNAQTAYNAAIPFRTVSGALASFPRDGKDSTAVVLLMPGSNYGSFILQEVHGYRKVVIRGAVFQDGEGRIEQGDEAQVISGASTIETLTVGNGAPTSNTITVSDLSGGGAIQTDDTRVGRRVRFDPNSSAASPTMVLGDLVRMQRMIFADTFAAAGFPGSGDLFFIEQPGVVFDFVSLGIVGRENFHISDSPERGSHSPSLSIVGLRGNRLQLHGAVTAELAFCEFDELQLRDFGRILANGGFTDELDLSHQLGAGLKVGESGLTATSGEQLILQNSAAQGMTVDSVDEFVASEGFFAVRTTIKNCDHYSVGTLRAQLTDPLLVRMGAQTPDSALVLLDSDGEVLSTQFDTPNPHSDSSLFDFEADDSVAVASIRLNGTGQSLRIRDVDMMFSGTTHAGAAPSGVLLDATGAVASRIDYDPLAVPPQGGTPVLASGLIALPGRVFFRPYELALTDQRDGADNHYLSPGLSSALVTQGAATLGSFYGRKYVQGGISVQCDTNGNTIPAYLVVQFVGDSTGRVRLATIFSPTGAAPTDQMASSVAGVLQQQILGAESKLAFGTCLSTGYTLISLNELPLQGTTLPAPLYISTNPGYATTIRPNFSGNATVRIGVLVRVVLSGGLPDARDNRSLIGLARLEVPTFLPTIVIPTITATPDVTLIR